MRPPRTSWSLVVEALGKIEKALTILGREATDGMAAGFGADPAAVQRSRKFKAVRIAVAKLRDHVATSEECERP